MANITKIMQETASRRIGTPEQFLRLVGATEESILSTDLQHSRYQNPSQLQELVEAYKVRKPIEPAEIFVDEAKNIISAEGRHRALAASKAGVKDFPIIIQQTKAIMKAGEGAAISKAGIAEVPAVLKATSRIMKNML
jgi:hypothetical protein